MPSWCPAVQPPDPWRSVELIGESQASIDRVEIASCVEGGDGILDVTGAILSCFHAQEPDTQELKCGDANAPLQWLDAHTLTGTVRVQQAQMWWPHTHGNPTLYDLGLGDLKLARIGRSIDVDRGTDGAGFQLVVNGVPVFARGACWTSADIVPLGASRDKLDALFALYRNAGFNILLK